ncbi:hypothetical protein HYFRA_00006196 [Hymenoscyphus fraxineus]|uniref:Uncharacterized protein n=1 Tax=Hymenoscyphus fraxineus TaxID=746836 RepID=A0A9N9L9Q0_9HELO|nr:hypothetical protein HYFRA_00006196 [Hymenoscyphus fraxineus]
MATANFSISEALETLRTSIPTWNQRLDELNGQIALRQIELARLDAREENGQRPPSTRSLKNKGSAESLRPKEADDNNPFAIQDTDILPSPPSASPKCSSPKQQQSSFSPIRRSSSSIKRGMASRPPKSNGNFRESPTSTQRQAPIYNSNNEAPPQAHPKNVLRKRRTGSMASGESGVTSKHRTRSMIIVYYDSAVQTAFEELVRFVSGSRNSMRKGKMAAKMAEMKRAAELEVEQDEENESNYMKNNGNGNAMKADSKAISSNLTADPLAVGEDDDEDEDMGIPQLKFVSTRQMGPPRAIKAPDPSSRILGAGMRRSYRRGGDSDSPDIFDELDKGLEWCQSQCEAGAHNFLREGECATEITNIKTKLAEVKATAEKEIERLKKEPPLSPGRQNLSVKPPRGFKQPQVRKDITTTKELEVDDEMDDEGLGEMSPPKLVFKRSGE